LRYIVKRWRVDEEKFFKWWVQSVEGRDCYASWDGYGGSFGSQDSGARHVVMAIKAIKDSDAFGTGRLLQQELTSAHDKGWDTLARVSSASAGVGRLYLAEVIKDWDNLASEVRELDDYMRSREKESELQRLRADGMRDRPGDVTGRVEEIRHFLDDIQEP
jgi:hypothetical protein